MVDQSTQLSASESDSEYPSILYNPYRARTPLRYMRPKNPISRTLTLVASIQSQLIDMLNRIRKYGRRLIQKRILTVHNPFEFHSTVPSLSNYSDMRVMYSNQDPYIYYVNFFLSNRTPNNFVYKFNRYLLLLLDKVRRNLRAAAFRSNNRRTIDDTRLRTRTRYTSLGVIDLND